MADCPMWRADCQARAAVDAVSGTARAVGAIARGSNRMLDLAGEASGKIGFLLPFLMIGFVVWVGIRLLSFGRDTALGFGDAFTGGAASDILAPRRKQAAPSRALRRTGGRAPARTRARSGAGTRLGQTLGAETKAKRAARRPDPFRPDPHTGQTPSLYDRSDDRSGRLTTAVVCAPDAAAGLMLLDSRMGGIRWSKGSTSKCDLNPAHRHFRYRRH